MIDTRRDSRPEGSPSRREKTTMTTCSSNHIYLYLSHYISCSIHGLDFTLDECKYCSSQQSNWRRSVCRETLRFWGIPERDPCMKMEEDLVWIQENLVQSLSCTTKSWWKLPMTKVYWNGSSEVLDDGLQIHGKLSWW